MRYSVPIKKREFLLINNIATINHPGIEYYLIRNHATNNKFKNKKSWKQKKFLEY